MELETLFEKTYKVENGTYFDLDTPDEVIRVLENVRLNRTRIILDYGKNGKSWNEKYDIQGYVGRTTGPVKSPILLFNSRSMGGSIILTDCILSIKTTKGKQLLYQA